MEYSEEVKKLAETLKKRGLAASMSDALERAQKMLGKKVEEEVEEIEDTTQTILSDVKEPEEKIIDKPEESPEVQEELKKEEVFANTADNEQGSNQNKINYSKEKKVNLSELFDVSEIIPPNEIRGLETPSIIRSGMISEHVKNHQIKGSTTKICHPRKRVVFNVNK